MTPAVSIITPTFNRHALLAAQHVHLLVQSEQDFEWLILDDGRSPRSRPRIRYQHWPPKMKLRPSATGCASGPPPR